MAIFTNIFLCRLFSAWVIFPFIVYSTLYSKVSVLERSSWRDPLPEWGRTKIFLGNWPPEFIHRPSRGNQTDWTHHQWYLLSISVMSKFNQSDFPCLFCGRILVEISMENFSSASFWQRVVPTAPFNTWQKRIDFTLVVRYY